MKNTYLALAVASAALIAAPAIAQDYQMEAGVSYSHISPDVGSNDYAVGVDFRYNFETVSTEDRPLAEAGFLGRNGGLNLSYNTQDKADVDTIQVGGDYWFNDIYVAATYLATDVQDQDRDDYDVRVGYMVNDNLRVHLGYTDVDRPKYNKGSVLLGAKYVANLRGHFVNLEAGWAENDDYRVLNARGDYFIANNLSVGAGLIKSTEDGSTIQADLGAKYFVLPNLSGELVYSINNATTKDDSAISLRLAARF